MGSRRDDRVDGVDSAIATRRSTVELRLIDVDAFFILGGRSGCGNRHTTRTGRHSIAGAIPEGIGNRGRFGGAVARVGGRPRAPRRDPPPSARWRRSSPVARSRWSSSHGSSPCWTSGTRRSPCSSAPWTSAPPLPHTSAGRPSFAGCTATRATRRSSSVSGFRCHKLGLVRGRSALGSRFSVSGCGGCSAGDCNAGPRTHHNCCFSVGSSVSPCLCGSQSSVFSVVHLHALRGAMGTLARALGAPYLRTDPVTRTQPMTAPQPTAPSPPRPTPRAARATRSWTSTG